MGLPRQKLRPMSRTLPPPNVLLRAATASRRLSILDEPAEAVRPLAPPAGLGWLPALSVVAAAGLLVMAAADYLARLSSGAGTSLFWLSLLIVTVPITFRLLVARIARSERLGLVMLFGIALYLVKVMQSPFGFTYADEYVHQYNLHNIFSTGQMFLQNPILPASTLYPGLETFTAGLQHLTGLDAFTAGLVVIGAARLIMMAALFLLYEQVSHSSRVAALGSVLYAGNSNFVFWSAQFSYESLALPLAILVLYVVARREDSADAGERLGLTLIALAGICSVVVTHHLSSYFLALVLVLWTVTASRARIALFGFIGGQLVRFSNSRLGRRLTPLFRRVVGDPAWPMHGQGAATGGPGGLALFAAAAALVWLFYVASLTLTYLSPVFGKAFVSLIGLIGGESTGRHLFQSGSGYVAPVAERAVALGSVLLLLLALPFGLRQVWRRGLHHPVMLLLSGAAVAYFSTLGLRLVPSAWEIGNRASEFLFIGLALVTAMARFPRLPKPSLGAWYGRARAALAGLRGELAARWARAGREATLLLPAPGAVISSEQTAVIPTTRALQLRPEPESGRPARRRSNWPARLALALLAAAIFSSGVIAGWLPQIRLAQLTRVEVNGRVLEPAGQAVARWMLAQHGPWNTIGSDEASGRVQLAYGWQHALAGRFPNIISILDAEQLADWQWETMRSLGISYMIIDRRAISADNMLGNFFDRGPGRELPANALIPPAIYLKFDGLPYVTRELDAGNLVLYYVRELVNGTAQR